MSKKAKDQVNKIIDKSRLFDGQLKEQIELFNTKDFSSSNKRIEQLFYKFAADIFYKSEPSPNNLLKEANLSRWIKYSAITLASLAFLFFMWMIIGSGQEIVYWGFIMLMMGVPFYVYMVYKK